MNKSKKDILLERYQYKLDYIEREHEKKLSEINSSKRVFKTDYETQTRHGERITAENERYNAELKKFNDFIGELEKYYDLPEVVYTSNPFTTNTEAEKMINEGFESIAIYDITDPQIKLPTTKLYKFRKK